MTISTIISLFSLLFGGGILVGIYRRIKCTLQNYEERMDALCKGVQDLLKDRLYEQHDKYCKHKGYSPIWAKENFESMYNSYHALGKNGVMDQKYEEFKAMPDEEVKK